MSKPDLTNVLRQTPAILELHELLKLIRIGCDGKTVVADTPFFLKRDGTLCEEDTVNPRLARYWLEQSPFLLESQIVAVAEGLESARFSAEEIRKLEGWGLLFLKGLEASLTAQDLSTAEQLNKDHLLN